MTLRLLRGGTEFFAYQYVYQLCMETELLDHCRLCEMLWVYAMAQRSRLMDFAVRRRDVGPVRRLRIVRVWFRLAERSIKKQDVIDEK